MQRRKFLASTVAAMPAVVSAPVLPQKEVVRKAFTVKAGESRFGERTPFRGVNPNDLKVSAKDTDGLFSMFEYVGKEKVGPPLHVHFDQDETFYVVEGEYLFQIGNETMTVKAGDTIFGARNVPHTWIQLSDSGKLVYSLQPAGKMEEFFAKFSQIKGRPSDEQIQQIHLEHGMKVLGPPLTQK